MITFIFFLTIVLLFYAYFKSSGDIEQSLTISIVALTLLLTSMLILSYSSHQPLISEPQIIGANPDELQTIKEVLNTTNSSIIHHISRIQVINSSKVPCSYGDAIGCTSISSYQSSSIKIVSSSNWIFDPDSEYIMCYSFEYTLQHEIGHVYWRYTDNQNNTEDNAHKYANQHTKEKGLC